MINVTLGAAETQKEKPFPKLMQHNDGTITLFTSKGEGTHIVGCAGAQIGFYSNEIRMTMYTDYNEPITIQNA